MGQPLQGGRPPAALHQRIGLAADRRQPVSCHSRSANPGLGRGARLAHQCPAARDDDRLPRVHPGPPGSGHQPRDRPVVRLPQLRRDPQLHRSAQAEGISRSSATPSRSHGLGSQARAVSDGLGQASGSLLQGRDRIGSADPRHGRFRAPGPVRLSRARARRLWGC